MKLYDAIQGWVDRQWRAQGLQFKMLLLPALIPCLAILMIGRTPVLTAIGWGWFGLWNSFVVWRYWVYVREVSREADKQYDRAGKFRLAEEYHDTESATASSERKRRKR